MARILVTGSGGFIGSALCPLLAARGHQVVRTIRPQENSALRRRMIALSPADAAEPVFSGEISPETDWADVLDGIDMVVHLAQQAHTGRRISPTGAEPAAAAALARAAAAAGARRLIYLSSIKAMGEATAANKPFRAGDPARPVDAYGRAKLATEQTLAAVAAETGLELVIVRPPLVYGPGVRANFRALMRLAASGLPLPFAAVDNRRSLIALDNLTDLLAAAAMHPAAAGQVLLASDGPAWSIAALIRLLAAEQGRAARLFAMPAAIFRLLRALPLVGPLVSGLTLSLEIDDSVTRTLLDWTPPVSPRAALAATARAFARR